MLEMINRYIHGYVSIPVILACREKGLLTYFKKNSVFTLTEITKYFNANEGYLQVALRLFESLGWLKCQHATYHVLLTSALVDEIQTIPQQVLFIYKTPLEKLFNKYITKRKLCYWLEEGLSKSAFSSPLQDFLEGVFIVPLMIALKKTYTVEKKNHEPLRILNLNKKLTQIIFKFMMQKSWCVRNGQDYFLTESGHFMLDRAFNMATAASYAPLLAQMSTLLFGNFHKIFQRNVHQNESHVDRQLNVLASGFQHEKYFSDIDLTILSIFNQSPVSEQPKYVIDMGCGDGTLLKRIYQLVHQSLRGSHLDAHPLYMIGVDYNQASLKVTQGNLKDIPHYTVWGDINDPVAMLSTLQGLGLTELDRSLHVRSFLDHDRPFIEIENMESIQERGQIPYEGAYVDNRGLSIPPAFMVQSLVEHFKRWAEVVNHHGLIILEVHALKPETILAYLDDNESLHFDALQAFSGQSLVSAEVFLMAAAEAGLLPKLNLSKRYPQVFPYTRITQNYFEKKTYQFVHAKKRDLPALIQLEMACWATHLQVSEAVLLKRLEAFPEGQIVVVSEDKIVGVIYTQRINDIDVLKNTPFNLIHTLHNATGSILQLIAINIAPEVQDRGIGDDLLNFVLHWSRLKSDIEKVVGVTRCANYKNNKHLSLSQYIEQHDRDSKGIDAILRFHTSHGAKIVDVLQNYRAEDSDNQGAGILIEYQIRNQHANMAYQNSSSNHTPLVQSHNTLKQDSLKKKKEIEEIIYACIMELLPAKFAEQFSPIHPLRELGFDSLGLLELRTLLNKRLELKIDSTFFFQFKTPATIIDHLQNKILSEWVQDKKVAEKDEIRKEKNALSLPEMTTTSSDVLEPIAIIGMACRLPGGINNPDDYWQVLEEGRDVISQMPKGRLTLNPSLDPLALGGYVVDVDKFDAKFFNISPREAELMDPQQRILLEVVWEALEQAAIQAESLRGSKTGVFVGIFSHDYETLINKNTQAENLDVYYGTGNSVSIASGRVSYALGLQGPSLTVNTACSSSLVAVHLACQSLRQEESTMALAGGVNLILSPELSLVFSKAGMISPEGRCKTFDAAANGYSRSEGAGMIVLKRLSKALADGDNILAVLRSSSVNQDGASNGLTAPNFEAQKELMSSALMVADLDPNTITYVEAHGTGTSLGDPVEVKAITEVYGRNRNAEHPLFLGSVKTNLGHTEAAAGVAGVIKAVLALQHKIVPPHIHFTKLNPHLELDKFDMRIPTVPVAWQKLTHTPRRAAVSSFGFSGTNAHVVVEEGPEKIVSKQQTKPYYLITLSAKEPELLKQRFEDLQSFLNKHSNLTLEALSYTLNIGRNHFNYRSAFVVSSIVELQDIFDQIKKNQNPESYFQGEVPNKLVEEVINSNVLKMALENLKSVMADAAQNYRNSLEIIANLYIKGYEINWNLLHEGEAHQKISLPTYPFLKESYWIPEANPLQAEIQTGLHPLVDANISTFDTQAYTKFLTGQEFYLAEHGVNDTFILPGVVYLEMAYAAGKLANPRQRISALRNITWLRPIGAKENGVQVEINFSSVDHNINFEVTSIPAAHSAAVVHAQGKLVYEFKHADTEVSLPLAAISERCQELKSRETIYALLDKLGLHLGPSFQVIQEFKINDDECLAKLKLPDHLIKDEQQFTLHPCLLDGALQTALVLLNNKVEGLHIPFNIEMLEVHHRIPINFYVHTILNHGPLPKFNIQLVDEDGKILVSIKGFAARSFVMETEKPSEIITYRSILERASWPKKIDNLPVVGPILIFDQEDDFVTRCRQHWPQFVIIHVKNGETFQQDGEEQYSINGSIENDHIKLFNILFEKKLLPRKIIYRIHHDSIIEAVDQPYINNKVKNSYHFLFHLSRSLLQLKQKENIQILIVNEGLQNLSSLFGQALVGFARVLDLENTILQCRTINTEIPMVELIDRLIPEFLFNDKEVFYTRDNNRFVRQFLENDKDESLDYSAALKNQGVYLITGGMGGLGLILAEYLAEQYQAKLVLVGRSFLTESQKILIKKLEKLGSHVIYQQTDVGKYEDLKTLLVTIKKQFGSLNGVFHGAGVLRDALIMKKSITDINEVLTPKVDGTIFLDAITQNEPLDFFILFSSVVSVLGNVGQSDYAYANNFMDQFAEYRETLRKQKQRIGKTIVINWPLWEEGGMHISDASRQWMENTFGVQLLKTKQGIDILLSALNKRHVQQIVLPGKKQKITNKMKQMTLDSIKQNDENIESTHSGLDNIDFLSEQVIKFLLGLVAEVLKYDIKKLNIEKPLGEYGIDSIGLTAVTNRLNTYYGLELSPAILFEYVTLSSLLQFLLEKHRSAIAKKHPLSISKDSIPSDQNVEQYVQPSMQSSTTKPYRLSKFKTQEPFIQSEKEDFIAVIGMSGIFPGSPNLDIFWENLVLQKDLIREIPRERWDWEAYISEAAEGHSKVKWGGFIENIDRFDAAFFNISPREVELMDPQQRLFLKATWQAFENAGYVPQTLKEKVGLFVGVATNDYSELLHKSSLSTAFVPTGTFFSILANRVSYLLNLQGPSEAIDTACSSSLIAIHNAVKAIHNGDCELAIAGGVNALLTPTVFLAFNEAGMLSKDGRCKTFDKDANGYVRGEGVGAILLKPLQKALTDHDKIYGVIKGTAVNHGGHVSSLTVPNLNAQADLVVKAIERAQVAVDTISYIETHGTGTALGDPVEVSGLKKAFRLLHEKQGKAESISTCGLGTVKTNIGHLEAAAGIAGVIKILLAMQYQKLPGNLHFNELNPYIKFQDSPFYVVEKTKDWACFRDEADQEIPRRAGVSSFGFGGANAHVVIEEAPVMLIADRFSDQLKPACYLLPLSARTESTLYQKLIDLQEWIVKQSNISLEDICFTLSVGRSHFEKRCAFIVSSIDDLKEKLYHFQNEKKALEFFNSINNDGYDLESDKQLLKETFEALKDQNSLGYQNYLETLANLYLKGVDIAWGELYQSEQRRRVPLPTYPFFEERYWVPHPIARSDNQEQILNNFEKILQGLQENDFSVSVLKQYVNVSNEVLN